MPQDRKKSLALLHFIVFLWGFTAVLGKGIHLDAPDIVFYRMSIAAASLGLFLLFRRKTIRIGLQLLLHILLGGILLTAHWYTFFAAIKASNVAVTLATIIPTLRDWMNLIILGTICTAYAFTAGIKVMRHISPYTVALVNNLEPIYGILLALLFFGKSEFMGYRFYLGAGIILTAIVIEGRIRQPKPKSD